MSEVVSYSKSLFDDVAIVTKRVSVDRVHDAPDSKVVRCEDGELVFYKRQQRVYVDDPSDVPDEYEVQEGERGGYYYDMPLSMQEAVPDGKDLEDWNPDVSMDERLGWSVLQGQGFYAEVEGYPDDVYDVAFSSEADDGSVEVVLEDADGQAIMEDGEPVRFSPDEITVQSRLKDALDEFGRPLNMPEISPPDLDSSLPEGFEDEMREKVTIDVNMDEEAGSTQRNEALNYLSQYYDDDTISSVEDKLGIWSLAGYQSVDEIWVAAMDIADTNEPPSALLTSDNELRVDDVEEMDREVVECCADLMRMSKAAIKEEFGESATVHRGLGEDTVEDYVQVNDDGSAVIKPQALESWSIDERAAKPQHGAKAVTFTKEFDTDDFGFFGPFVLGDMHGTYKELTLNRNEPYVVSPENIDAAGGDISDFKMVKQELEIDTDELYRIPLGVSIIRYDAFDSGEEEEEKSRLQKPFADYDDFDSCVSDNQDKEDPEAYCAQIHYNATGEWPAEKFEEESMSNSSNDNLPQIIEADEPSGYEYPEAAPEDAPEGVARAVERFREEVSEGDKANQPLLYWLLGTGTPAYKMSKEDAEYQEEAHEGERCVNCEHYFEDMAGKGICSQVRGDVERDHWCRLWRALGPDQKARPDDPVPEFDDAPSLDEVEVVRETDSSVEYRLPNNDTVTFSLNMPAEEIGKILINIQQTFGVKIANSVARNLNVALPELADVVGQAVHLLLSADRFEPESLEKDESDSEQAHEQSGQELSDEEWRTKNLFGQEQTGPSVIVDKDEDEDDDSGKTEWVPYTGPDGGTGWQDRSDPNNITYQSEPPGVVPPHEELADPDVEIDPVDVETNDYIQVTDEDGETIGSGIVTSVQRFTNAVELEFDNGDFVLLTERDAESVSVEIDDDFDAEAYRSQVQGVEDTYSRVDGEMEFDNWPDGTITSRVGLNPENTKSTITETFNRTNHEEIVDQTIDHVESVMDKVSRSGYYSEEQKIMFDSSADTDVVHHEMAHAMVDAFGYSQDIRCNIFAQLYDGTMDHVEVGDSFHDIVDELVDARLEEVSAVTRVSDGAKEFHEMRDSAKEKFDDEPLEKEDFKLSGAVSEDTPEEMKELISEINDSWERIFDGEATEIYREYSAMNANETFAMVHECLQGGFADKEILEDMVREHQSLLEAYFEVFEPADVQKSMLNDLWPDEAPFPETEAEIL